MISLQKISRAFAGQSVLADIDLELPAHQTHVLLGLSGSGKSTLLRLMAGLIEPDRGTLIVDGIQVTRATQAQVAARVGYVIQDGGLFPHFTAQENVTLIARCRRWPAEKIRARLAELAQLVGIEASVLTHYPKQLSGGQKQRVGLMRAIFLDPGVYLLDEPLGALDPITRFELQKELKRIFNLLKKTVVIVTHDVGEAAFFGHTISLLHQGSVVQQGSFRELVQNPKSPFVTQFITAQRPPPEFEEIL